MFKREGKGGLASDPTCPPTHLGGVLLREKQRVQRGPVQEGLQVRGVVLPEPRKGHLARRVTWARRVGGFCL